MQISNMVTHVDIHIHVSTTHIQTKIYMNICVYAGTHVCIYAQINTRTIHMT